MKVLICHPGPSQSVADVYTGYAKGFAALGCETQLFNLDDRLQFYSNITFEGAFLHPEEAITFVSKGLEAKCYEFWPDLIVVISGFFIPGFTWDLWRARPHNVACVMTESPYEDDKQVALVERAEPSLVVLNDPTNLEMYRDVGARTFYIPHSFDPDLHQPDPTAEPKWDFAFCGTGYPSRMEFFEAVDWDGLDVALAGHWQILKQDGELGPGMETARLEADSRLLPFLIHDIEDCYDNTDAVALYHRARASTNLYRANRRPEIEANAPELAHGYSMGPREVELAACGTFFLRESRGEGDLILNMLPTFSEPGEFGEKLRWWLNHPDERDEAALCARAAVADRTFVHHARRLLALLP